MVLDRLGGGMTLQQLRECMTGREFKQWVAFIEFEVESERDRRRREGGELT